MSENQTSNVSMNFENTESTSMSPVSTVKPRLQRWREEAEFFDNVAATTATQVLPIDPLALRRYSASDLHRRFSKEFRFWLMGPLQDKRILDVGCGDGMNAVMMAMMGARVTGIDISSKAIEVAQRRAELNNVADRVQFICSPIETVPLADQSFDIIWGDGILHHVLDDLEPILQHLRPSLKSDGCFLYAEPVNLCQSLRKMRKIVPLRTDCTPGERPLVSAEMDLVQKHAGEFHKRYYGLFGRLDRFILTSHNYERSSALQRFIVNCIDLVDYILLSVPIFKRLASTCVMYGKPKQ